MFPVILAALSMLLPEAEQGFGFLIATLATFGSRLVHPLLLPVTLLLNPARRTRKPFDPSRREERNILGQEWGLTLGLM